MVTLPSVPTMDRDLVQYGVAVYANRGKRNTPHPLKVFARKPRAWGPPVLETTLCGSHSQTSSHPVPLDDTDSRTVSTEYMMRSDSVDRLTGSILFYHVLPGLLRVSTKGYTLDWRNTDVLLLRS